MDFPKKLTQKMQLRKQENALRSLTDTDFPIDFLSNDYLGFARCGDLYRNTQEFLHDRGIMANGSTGSRLISGNDALYEETERMIAAFHESWSALLYNSGYDANLGFFSCVPQRGDVILYDALCHASIRDGIRLSQAKSFRFQHNDLEDLQRLILLHENSGAEIYIATESIFSMDGDAPALEPLVSLSRKHACRLVIDEAHALGVFGENGSGLLQQLKLQEHVFARLVTFGKGLGCHGAAILGSGPLRDYLINFSRSFIYTTGLPPHSIATVLTAYKRLQTDDAQQILQQRIGFFNREKQRLSLKPLFVYSKSAIQCAIVPGNDTVKAIAQALQDQGFGVKAILSPTVPKGEERLRICIHSYNSESEITRLLQLLHELIFE